MAGLLKDFTTERAEVAEKTLIKSLWLCVLGGEKIASPFI